jgi:hypothetical protein
LDVIIEGDLAYVAEGDALTILHMDRPGTGTAVLSRMSPDQGRIQALAVSGGIAYLITPIGLATVDVRDPYLPQQLGFLPGGGEAIKVAGQFAVVAARAAGLRVLNVSNPKEPVVVGKLAVPGKSQALQLDSDRHLVFLAADDGGLRVIDVSAPDLPSEVGSLIMPGGVQDVKLQGKKLAVSSGDRIFFADVSYPEHPEVVGCFAPPRKGRRVAVENQFAYVADVDGGLKIFDVSSSTRPVLIYAETDGEAYDVVVRGSRAYLAAGEGGLRILNVRNPARPEPVAQLSLEGGIVALDIEGDTLLAVTRESGLAVINVTNELRPTIVSSIQIPGDARDVWVGESLAYVAAGPAGLVIVNLTDLREPKLQSTLLIAGEAQALSADGNLVYVAAHDGGLQIVDASRPAAPNLIGALGLPENQHAMDLVVSGRRAYLALQGDAPDSVGAGLAIVDVGFRDQPVLLARVAGPASGVALWGGNAVIVGDDQLMSVDVRTSSNPVVMGRYQAIDGVGGWDWLGALLFFTSSARGPQLTVLDTSQLPFPREWYNQGPFSGGGEVVAVGGLVYFAAGRHGLRVLDATEIANPVDQVLYDPMDTLTYLYSQPEEPEILYGAGETGWSITDVSDPQLPRPVSHVWIDSSIQGLEKVGTRLYATSSTLGMLTYDLADIGDPHLVGRWTPGTPLGDVMAYGAYLYLTDGRAGLHVVDPRATTRPNRLQTVPLSGAVKHIYPINDEQAYATTWHGTARLLLLDLGHPTLGVEPLGQFAATAKTLQVAGPFAYIVDGNAFSVWHLREVGSEQPAAGLMGVGTAELVARLAINGEALLVAGEAAYVGSDAGHVSLLDLSNPFGPRVLSMMGNGGTVRGMVVHEHRRELLVGVEATYREPNSNASYGAGQFRVWNLEDPGKPEPLATVGPLPRFVALEQVPGQERLLAVGEALSLYDFGGSPTVTLVMSIPLSSAARCLHLEGDLALVGSERGLLVFDNILAGAPELIGELPLGQAVRAVTARGERAFLAVENQGGLVVDLSDPASPVLMAGLPSPTGDAPQQLYVQEGRLWAIWDERVSWMDVSQPRPGPAELAVVLPDGMEPTDLEVVGTLAYVADAHAGLAVLDISDPAAPVQIGRLETPGHARAIALGSDGLGYIADSECGLRVINLQDPTHPAEVGFWHTGYALDVMALGTVAYVADIGELVTLAFDPDGIPVMPPVPQTPEPADGTTFYLLPSDGAPEPRVTLGWGPLPFDCDPLSYDLHLGTENPPPLVATELGVPTIELDRLERRTRYYWRVVARDRQGDLTIGPVWSFQVTTASEPPATPVPTEPPELAPPEQHQVVPLIAGLALFGLLAVGLSTRQGHPA